MRSCSPEDRESVGAAVVVVGGVLVTRSRPMKGALCLFSLQPEHLPGEKMAGAQTGQGNANQQLRNGKE